MSQFLLNKIFPLLLAGVCTLVSGQVSADKPEWANNGKQNSKHEQRTVQSRGYDKSQEKNQNRRDDYRHNEKISRYFDDRHRVVVHDYYINEYRRGYCPPGLKYGKSGCIPRGQAKKWSRGERLPRQVVYYDLPPQIVVNLGHPPAGHRYVRVASDILLIAVGTGLIVDVIQGWNN